MYGEVWLTISKEILSQGLHRRNNQSMRPATGKKSIHLFIMVKLSYICYKCCIAHCKIMLGVNIVHCKTVTQVIYSDILSIKFTFTASYKIFLSLYVICGLTVRLQNTLAESKKHEGKYEASHPNLRIPDTSGKSFSSYLKWLCGFADVQIQTSLQLWAISNLLSYLFF